MCIYIKFWGGIQLCTGICRHNGSGNPVHADRRGQLTGGGTPQGLVAGAPPIDGGPRLGAGKHVAGGAGGPLPDLDRRGPADPRSRAGQTTPPYAIHGGQAGLGVVHPRVSGWTPPPWWSGQLTGWTRLEPEKQNNPNPAGLVFFSQIF